MSGQNKFHSEFVQTWSWFVYSWIKSWDVKCTHLFKTIRNKTVYIERNEASLKKRFFLSLSRIIHSCKKSWLILLVYLRND